jgi:hypothetical protein
MMHPLLMEELVRERLTRFQREAAAERRGAEVMPRAGAGILRRAVGRALVAAGNRVAGAAERTRVAERAR